MIRTAAVFLVTMLAGALAISCGGDDETAETPQETVNQTTNDTTTSPAAQGSDSVLDRSLKPKAEWILSMPKWPDTLHWTIDSSFAYSVDDLEIRLRISIAQDLTETRFQNEQPVFPEILMNVSPIPKWDYARNLAIDSLVLYDPVENRRLPALPILSNKRSYENQTVRTLYYANAADPYRISPDLEDGHPLDATLYLTWDERTIIADLPTLTLTHVLKPLPQEEDELPPDYRSIPLDPREGGS